jgi:branched-chain amino acid transport system substrate-binding protein
MKRIAIFQKSATSRFAIGKTIRDWGPILCLGILLSFQALGVANAQPPSSSSAPDDTLLFREGEVFLSKGDPQRALWRFKQLVTDFPDSSLCNEAKFRMGICYSELKRPRDAIRVLNELFSGFLAPARMTQVFTLLGDNYLEMKDPLSALHWYGKGLFVPNQPHEELKRKVRSIIDTFDTEEKLKQIESLYRGAYGGGYAKLKRALLAKRRGDDALARRLVAELDKEYRNMDYWPQTREFQEPIPEPIPAPRTAEYTLGVILPLSGTYQPLGAKVLQAIQLATQEANVPGKLPFLSLAIRDTKGDPVEAEKAVEDLVANQNVIAILGPLLSVTVDAAAQKSQQLGVPLLTFAQKESLPGEEGFVFQDSVTPSAQIDTLVAFAVRELELRTFAIFYPNSPYGLHFKQLFTQEVIRRGGKVTGSVAYQENQTDFGQEIKFFFKVKTIPGESNSLTKEGDFVPGYTVDGLFIPDTHQRAGLILSQLAYYNVKGVTFLGTNAWNHPDLISIARKSAEGAIFVDAFSKGNSLPATERFVKQFRNAYNRDPETLEALSFEGAELLKKILLTKGVSSPGQLKEELHRVHNFQGPCGRKGWGEDGTAIRALSILRVKNNQIQHFLP